MQRKSSKTGRSRVVGLASDLGPEELAMTRKSKNPEVGMSSSCTRDRTKIVGDSKGGQSEARARLRKPHGSW